MKNFCASDLELRPILRSNLEFTMEYANFINVVVRGIFNECIKTLHKYSKMKYKTIISKPILYNDSIFRPSPA